MALLLFGFSYASVNSSICWEVGKEDWFLTSRLDRRIALPDDFIREQGEK